MKEKQGINFMKTNCGSSSESQTALYTNYSEGFINESVAIAWRQRNMKLCIFWCEVLAVKQMKQQRKETNNENSYDDRSPRYSVSSFLPIDEATTIAGEAQ